MGALSPVRTEGRERGVWKPVSWELGVGWILSLIHRLKPNPGMAAFGGAFRT